MSAAGRSEEQSLCSICQQVFSEPVSTPCGHNFCKRCISRTWDRSKSYFCPVCKKVFFTRPQLKKNTLLSERVAQLQMERKRTSSLENMPLFREVKCDACSEPKQKAVKSCLVCLSSFCERHLQPHLSMSRLKKHQLTEPVDNLKGRTCPKHQRPLDLFCSTDQSCVCTMCVLQEHKNHDLLSLEEACERRKASLLQSQAQSQKMVEQRRLKVQEIRAALELSETVNHREAAAGLQAFTALMQSVQSRQDHFLEQLQEKQKSNQKQAQELLRQLQQEMHQLEKSSTEAQQLSLSTDPLHVLQSDTALPPTGLKEWSSVRFEPQTCEGDATHALSEVENSFSEDFNKVCKQLDSTIELRRLQQFAVDITLDPDTAHPDLVLSEDLKQVHHTDMTKKKKKQLPDSKRFTKYCDVLGKQSFSSGSFYFEVQVKGKTRWDLGVAQESITRKGQINLSPKHGFWTIILRDRDEYRACCDPSVRLFPQRPPQKVGVFVDYGAGLVSFYDGDSADLLYSFTDCCFSERLFPFFSPCNNEEGTNSAPLIISAVDKNLKETDRL